MKKVGYGLLAIGVVGSAYAFCIPKGEYGSPEYRDTQPLGAKVLLGSVIIGGIGYFIIKMK